MGRMIEQTLVWIDTDIAIGHKSGHFAYCDVDDAYALTAMLRSVEIDVVGISSTLGNTDDIDVSTSTARHFMKNYGPNSAQVYKGAMSRLPEDPSKAPSNEAVEALAKTLENDRVTILAIGAATNIAILLLKYPQLGQFIDEIVLVAGRRDMEQHFFSGKWQLKPFRDLNFEFDPIAFKVLLESQIKLTLIPFEACHHVWIRPENLIDIGKSNRVGKYLVEHSLGWIAEWETVFGANGFNPFDLVAAGYLINPNAFTAHAWQAEVQEGPDDTDPDKTKPYLICNENINHGRPVNYCTSITKELKPLLLERICSHDMSAFVLGMSHVNVIVPSVEEGSEYYARVLGFEQAFDHNGNKMDYEGVEMKPFALDAGIMDAKVNVDVRFLKHPQANVYLELMSYHTPKGKAEIPEQPKTYDMGGPRHIAMEVSNCNEVFRFLKDQEGVTMINTSKNYHPIKLDGFPITFFYWIDKYGIQWEMEEGRQIGLSRGIV